MHGSIHFKNPVARFEGPVGHERKARTTDNTDAPDKSEDTGMGLRIGSAGSFHGFGVSHGDGSQCCFALLFNTAYSASYS